MPTIKDQKLAFLSMLLEKKDIALGSLSAKLTKATKNQVFNDMTTVMKKLGVDIKDTSEFRAYPKPGVPFVLAADPNKLSSVIQTQAYNTHLSVNF